MRKYFREKRRDQQLSPWTFLLRFDKEAVEEVGGNAKNVFCGHGVHRASMPTTVGFLSEKN